MTVFACPNCRRVLELASTHQFATRVASCRPCRTTWARRNLAQVELHPAIRAVMNADQYPTRGAA